MRLDIESQAGVRAREEGRRPAAGCWLARLAPGAAFLFLGSKGRRPAAAWQLRGPNISHWSSGRSGGRIAGRGWGYGRRGQIDVDWSCPLFRQPEILINRPCHWPGTYRRVGGWSSRSGPRSSQPPLGMREAEANPRRHINLHEPWPQKAPLLARWDPLLLAHTP